MFTGLILVAGVIAVFLQMDIKRIAEGEKDKVAGKNQGKLSFAVLKKGAL
ncbi:MAG: hypothetical protein LRY73_17880 [Bacillus sp. (in: Bacteria)]|nr:hypothetical protein [Bacillus sp. (in: firmicutes)]